MGRPTLYKRGAMTPAERQRRHRKKLSREKRAAEVLHKQELNNAEGPTPKQLELETEQRELEEKRQELARQNPALPNATPADELARQIGEYLTECPEITIDDVRAAIDRRFGPP
ncbi:MAG: hypothetical protein J2P48_01575 [Alphaproteobacteria bacterium]|nr:hypothetical protein [Alphaproteobacteria bacterium]